MLQWKRVAGEVHWLVVLFAMALVCVPGRESRADEKSDLIGKIEDKLEDAADALERLPDDSNDSAIDRARGYVAEARRSADELGRVAGDDSSAKRIAEDFDDVQDDFHEALVHLRNLKAGQRNHEPAVSACTDRDKELVRLARELEAKNDPDGLIELPKEASRVQELTKRQLEELARHDDKMEDWADDAGDFRGDGPWRDLVASVAQTARRAYELWHRGHEQSVKACESLARGVDHPEVKEALAKLSSSAGGRKAIMEQLDKDARALASALAGVSEDSGMGSVERAKELLQGIARGVESLGRTATTDKAARLILEKWPQGIRQLQEALDDLEDLKRHQHDMDPLPERCALKARELQDAIARNGDDPDGIDELQQLADKIAEPVRAGVAKADERMKEEEGDRERAKAVSFSDGPWSDVRAAQLRDTEETFATFEDGHEKTKVACADIMRGKDGPIVNAAIERLRRSAASTGDALDRDVARWLEAARRTYLLDCKSMEELWQAYCGTDFEPGESGEDERAKQTGASLQDRMQREMGPLLDELKALKARVQALVKKRETKARGESLLASLDKEEQRLKRLENQGTWRGNNHPLIQYANRYGDDRHEAEWSSKGCQVPTTSTGSAYFSDATHKKPDCIIAKRGQCEIWEFKPASDSGKADGAKQIADYSEFVPRYYTDKHRRNEAPSAVNGGMDFLVELRKHCLDEDDNAIVFKTVDVKIYNMCDKQYVCEAN